MGCCDSSEVPEDDPFIRGCTCSAQHQSQVQPIHVHGKHQPCVPCVPPEYPDPNTVPIMTFTPSKPANFIKIEDTFWDQKRQLIPSYSALKWVDEHAFRAPNQLKSNADALVVYLIGPVKSEVEKVRVLVKWIGEHIAYDVAGRVAGNADSTLEGVLRTGKAVCDGYVHVLFEFCKRAHVQCEKISGMMKTGEAPPKDVRVVAKRTHSWNRVRISGYWYLIDSTWCAGSVDGSKFTKNWNESWFLTDPEAFAHTHLPLDETEKVVLEPQLIKRPFATCADWDTVVYRSPETVMFRMAAMSHPYTRLTNNVDEVVIRFKLTVAKFASNLSFYCELTREDAADGNRITLNKQAKHWIMISLTDSVVSVRLRFPSAGMYLADILARLEYCEVELKKPFLCFQYRISHTGESGRAFPVGPNSTWGESNSFLNAGFKVVGQTDAVVEAVAGKATIEVKLPSWGYVPNLFHFTKIDEKEMTKLDDHVYAEKIGNLARYHVQCPSAGEYRLEIYVKFSVEKDFIGGAAFLIVAGRQSGDVIGTVYKLPSRMMSQLAGPEPNFYKMGLTTQYASSTVNYQSSNTAPTIILKKTKPVTVQAQLYCADNNVNKLLRQIEDKQQNVYSVQRLHKPGYYWLELYVAPPNTKSLSFAGAFCCPFFGEDTNPT